MRWRAALCALLFWLFWVQGADITSLPAVVAGAIDANDPFSYSPDAQYALLLSSAEDAQFQQYCAAPNAAQYGFANRGLANADVDKAPQGGWWWWNGLPQ